MKIRQITFSGFLAALFLATAPAYAEEEEWKVPAEQQGKISFSAFTEDNVSEGGKIYQSACEACHGTPKEKNFVLMVPPPKDPASDEFQNQTDGSIYYKIANGRNLMPTFGKSYSEDEIWNLIAYIRSFNPKYKQTLPDLRGIHIPKMEMELNFDPNVGKLVVKVTEDGQPGKDVEVTGYVSAMFGKLHLGKAMTDHNGRAYINVEEGLPGDEKGMLATVVKVKKGYGFAKKEALMPMGTPTIKASPIAGRHLWSPHRDAPLWIEIVFHAAVLFFWGVIFFVLYRLWQMKKIGSERA